MRDGFIFVYSRGRWKPIEKVTKHIICVNNVKDRNVFYVSLKKHAHLNDHPYSNELPWYKSDVEDHFNVLFRLGFFFGGTKESEFDSKPSHSEILGKRKRYADYDYSDEESFAED